MLYTIGHKESYDNALESAKTTSMPPKKVGCQEVNGAPYPGGIIFESEVEARIYITMDGHTSYDVYGLNTTLDNTYIYETDHTRRLINSVEIIPLIKP